MRSINKYFYSMVYINFFNCQQGVSQTDFNHHLSLLPPDLQLKNKKYAKVKDKELNLFGKILLKEAFARLGLTRNCLEHLEYDQNNRPYVPGSADFNISHTSDLVVCASSTLGRIGIDTEKECDIELPLFENVMSTAQWVDIKMSKDPLQSFYRLWTIKESVVKEDGRGMQIPLQNIIVDQGKARLKNEEWEIREILIGNGYCTHVASKSGLNEVVIEEFLLNKVGL